MKKPVCFLLTLACLCLPCGVTACAHAEEARNRYEITVEYVPETATLAGTTKLTFENRTDEEISTLKFQLYPNAYRKDATYRPVSKAYESAAYYAGESYGEMVISSVNGAKNWEVMGEDENVLQVHLERSLYPSEEVVLDIGFLLKLANVHHRTGVGEHTVNLGNFFPVLCAFDKGGFVETAYYSDGDPFLSECADFQVTLTLPKEYTAAATGEISRERTLERKKEYVFNASCVRDFAFVLSDEFKVVKTETSGNVVEYYYYSDKNPQASLAVAAESFAYYEKTFGEYPHAVYKVAQTGFCLGGMEYPCLSMISDALWENKTAQARAIAHETAHQWWYGAVGSNPIENAWQDEGLAEYSAITFFENYEKYGITREDAVRDSLKEYRSYYDVYGSVLGRTDTRMTRHLKEYLSDYEYKCLSYDKAVVMFDTLRKSVGEEKFFAGLKKYYKENKGKIATPESLIGAFERTGVDANGFFDSFLSGKAIL